MTMRIVHNSLKPEWARDIDSGDYPSNAGSCARRPRRFVESIEGCLTIVCEPPDDDEDLWRDFLDSVADDVCPTVRVTEWRRFSEAIVHDRQTIVWVAQEWEED
jgi:hypothetical protein